MFSSDGDALIPGAAAKDTEMKPTRERTNPNTPNNLPTGFQADQEHQSDQDIINTQRSNITRFAEQSLRFLFERGVKKERKRQRDRIRSSTEISEEKMGDRSTDRETGRSTLMILGGRLLLAIPNRRLGFWVVSRSRQRKRKDETNNSDRNEETNGGLYIYQKKERKIN